MKLARARQTIGLSLMSASLLVAVLAAPTAVAAEGDEVPEDREVVELERRAYWNADHSKYSENVMTSQFPPEAVCLVAPGACFFPEGDQDPSSELPTGQLNPFTEEGEQGEDGLGALGNSTTSEAHEQEQELLATMAEHDDGTEPSDPVPADHHPVSVAFGKPYYRAAIEFPLPPLPDGHRVDRFTMVLTQGDPTYANESPAFRQAVLAALTCASENEESPFGRCTPEEFEKIPDRDLSDPDNPLTVEACPITGTWEEGPSQDEDDLPEVNCLYATAGIPVEVDEDTTLWVFDLNFMAQAWYTSASEGGIEPNGILLRPGAAENFAYGDPETTYSKQVTFAPEVEIASETSEAPVFNPPPPLPTTGFGSGGTGSTDVFATPSGSGFSQPVNMPSGGSEQPPMSDPGAGEQPAVADQTEGPETLAVGSPLGEPENPWWLWLLVVPFLGGAWVMTRALEEQAAVATQRSGAMTRLLERRSARSSPDLITG